MELDDLKPAWHDLDRRLQQQHALQLHLVHEAGTAKMKSSLRPLFWGQVLQIGFGLLFVLLAARFWSSGPTLPHLVVAGVVVHAYGVATIVVAGVTLALMRGIDYTAPVLAIQKQLARLQVHYIRSGMVAGLPWWFLWVPLLLVLSGLAGVDLHARAPGLAWMGLGVGVAGLLATFCFHLWSRHPSRAALARRLDDSATGGSLRRARAHLEELLRFERE
jgi:hypothetical protein